MSPGNEYCRPPPQRYRNGLRELQATTVWCGRCGSAIDSTRHMRTPLIDTIGQIMGMASPVMMATREIVMGNADLSSRTEEITSMLQHTTNDAKSAGELDDDAAIEAVRSKEIRELIRNGVDKVSVWGRNWLTSR
jgi:methyl-accepting chemotaxis protein